MRHLLIALAALFLLAGCPKDDKGADKPASKDDSAAAKDDKDDKKDEAKEDGEEEEGGW